MMLICDEMSKMRMLNELLMTKVTDLPCFY